MDSSLPVPAPDRRPPAAYVAPPWTSTPRLAPPGPPAGEGSLRFEELWTALRRGVWLIVGVTAAVTTLVVVYTLLLPKEYEAEAIVSIDTERAATAAAAAAAAGGGAATTVIERRGIESELGQLTYSEELRRRVAGRLLETHGVVGGEATFPLLTPDESGALPSRNTVARRVGESMMFEPLGNQEMIAVRAVSRSPAEAARLANFYAEEYRTLAREGSRASVVAAREFLEEQVDRLGNDLASIDGSVAEFSASRRIPELGPGGARVVEEASAFRTRRDQVAMDLARQQFALDVLQDEISRYDPEGASVRTNTIVSMETEAAAYDRQISDLRIRAEQYYAVDPSLRGNEARVPELAEITRSLAHYEGLKADLTARIARLSAGRRVGDDANYVATLQAQRLERQAAVRGLQVELGTLDRQLGAARAQIGGVPQAAVQLDQLERRRSIVASWYATYLADLQRVMVAEQSELGYVEVVSPAYVPARPARPNLPQNTALGLLLGLGFGIGLALARQATQREVQRPEELASQGYRILGVVPSMHRQIRDSFGRREAVEVEGREVSTRLLTMLEPWSPVAENFRLIRTNLLLGDGLAPLGGDGEVRDFIGDGGPQVILITSPEAGAGKTVTSTNLAVALAANGRRTLLVDADLRRPSVHKMLGLDGSHGLADILEHPLDWLRGHAGVGGFEGFETYVENLDCLPAGRPSRPPSELVGADVLRHVLARARTTYQTIIIDSPPVLAAADAVLLARLADATILVVSAEQTDLRSIEQATRALEAVGRPVAGTIVNRFDEARSYGYAYGYTGGEPYGEAPGSPAAPPEEAEA